MAASSGPALGSLERIAADFIASCHASDRLDWRYYPVAYPALREGESRIYYGEHRATRGIWGYSMRMLGTASLAGSASYRDPYLLAIYRACAVEDRINAPWFRGYETTPSWLQLSRSGGGIRCVEEGLQLAPPQDDGAAGRFGSVCRALSGTDAGFLSIRQVELDGELVDTEDRVMRGAARARALVEVGL